MCVCVCACVCGERVTYRYIDILIHPQFMEADTKLYTISMHV